MNEQKPYPGPAFSGAMIKKKPLSRIELRGVGRDRVSQRDGTKLISGPAIRRCLYSALKQLTSEITLKLFEGASVPLAHDKEMRPI